MRWNVVIVLVMQLVFSSFVEKPPASLNAASFLKACWHSIKNSSLGKGRVPMSNLRHWPLNLFNCHRIVLLSYLWVSFGRNCWQLPQPFQLGTTSLSDCYVFFVPASFLHICDISRGLSIMVVNRYPPKTPGRLFSSPRHLSHRHCATGAQVSNESSIPAWIRTRLTVAESTILASFSHLSCWSFFTTSIFTIFVA